MTATGKTQEEFTQASGPEEGIASRAGHSMSLVHQKLTYSQSDPLPTTFTCLFCNHEKSVTVKMDKKAGVGHLDCKVCGQKFQCGINYLSAPVDVYSEWVDAADAVAKGDAAARGSESIPPQRSARQTAADRYANEDEDDHRYEGEGIVADDEFD
ncbi:Elf1-domain-containing protein [Whalleya microplaca]|nr:Elf1-domain-containing protein [Whalleya microplaca]